MEGMREDWPGWTKKLPEARKAPSQRSKQKNQWRSHRAGNNLCSRQPGWKDHITRWVLSRDFRGHCLSAETNLALDLP